MVTVTKLFNKGEEMSETVEFEIKNQFKNYLVIVKTMSNDREKSFYSAYGKDALIFGYIMKSKIIYRNFYVAKTFKKLHYFDRDSEKRQKVFTSYSEIPSYKLKEIISVLDYYHINYIIVDKIQNYKVLNNTSAELIYERVNSNKEHMGLTNWLSCIK